MTRIAKRTIDLGIQVTPFEAIAAPPSGAIVYRIKDIFTVDDGNWDNGVERWARDAYLRPWGAPDYFDDAGAAQNIFGRVERESGGHITDVPIHYWTYNDDSNHVRVPVKPRSGWANIAMWPSSSFVPERGERGPWAWAVANAYSDIVTGAGLPARHHVSWFAVWQAVQYVPVQPPIDPDPIKPPSEAVTKAELLLVANGLQKQVDELKAIISRWDGE